MIEYEYEEVYPLADSVIQSLRSIGYKLETAIADIVDNSISASATKIDILFYWNPERPAYISFTDDGKGMSEKELVDAMRIGSTNPLDQRDNKDLGRFGMGLKTASFSQCKRLSVITKKDEKQSFRSWDLEAVRQTKKWALLKKPADPMAYKILPVIKGESGTAVLWEDLDRLVNAQAYSSKAYDAFLRSADLVERHLSRVFHRFLVGPKSITITINGIPIKPWDPFLTTQDATQELPEDTYREGDELTHIYPYVLPHHSKLSQQVFDVAGGIRGWNDMQGFYVYRNKRLLVSGSWLGLFKKEEPCKLARIMVDISSDSDFSWQIDIKKSQAKPPQYLVDALKRNGQIARDKSYKIYYYRGVAINNRNSNNSSVIWEQMVRRGHSFYQLNKNHSLYQNILSECSSQKELLMTYLSLLEETVPSNQLNYNFSSIINQSIPEPDQQFIAPEKDRIMQLISDAIKAFQLSGMSVPDISHYLKNIVPFKNYPDLVEICLTERTTKDA